MTRAPIRIANASGFYGDRLPAMLEVIQDGPVDVVTGDYLAELTMLILWKARRKDPSAGYARTFLTQLEQVLGIALDRGVKIVTNAGGLNPSGLAERVGELAAKLGLAPKVAWIDGDDLAGRLPQLLADGHDFTHLDTGQALRGSGVEPLTANAYLGGWGITAALDAGADIVICPRVTDASLVTGPAAWWHGWARTDFDALAGAVAAGHVIECGPQATGGNYPFPQEITRPPPPRLPDRRGRGRRVQRDHQASRHRRRGLRGHRHRPAAVRDRRPRLPEPRRHRALRHHPLAQEAPTGCGSAARSGQPAVRPLKVAINYSGGFRNTMTLVLTGLDIESKAAAAQAQLFDALGGKERFDEVDIRLLRFDQPDAPTNAQATAHLQITVKARDTALGRPPSPMRRSGCTSAGTRGSTPRPRPTDATEFGVYWPALIPAELVTQRVTLPNGTSTVVPHADAEEGTSWSPGPTDATSKGAAGAVADGLSGATEERGSAAREEAALKAPVSGGSGGSSPREGEEGASWSPGPAGATEERGSAGGKPTAPKGARIGGYGGTSPREVRRAPRGRLDRPERPRNEGAQGGKPTAPKGARIGGYGGASPREVRRAPRGRLDRPERPRNEGAQGGKPTAPKGARIGGYGGASPREVRRAPRGRLDRPERPRNEGAQGGKPTAPKGARIGGVLPPGGGGVPPGDTATVRAPLGLICGARSGDKGGNANVGLWTRTDEEYAWLRGYLSTERFRQLLPEAAGLPIQRYDLPNLRAVNFVIVGLLGDGVASSARPDPQAKGLGEYVRSRYVDLPAELAP